MEAIKKINPVVAVAICAALLVLAVVVGWKSISPAGWGEKQAIVRPANPDDPKFKPSPRLGVGGGGT